MSPFNSGYEVRKKGMKPEIVGFFIGVILTTLLFIATLYFI